jgi:hypothetical protein
MSRVSIQGGFFEEEGHQYFNPEGQRVLSTTQMLSLAGLTDYSMVKQSVLEWKSQIGIAVHAAGHYLLEGDLDWDTLSDPVVPYVTALEMWADQMKFKAESSEQTGICSVNGMQFGYRFDHRGTLLWQGKRRKALVELKTVTAPSIPAWRLQTAGYEIASPRVEDGYLRVALQLRKDGTFRPYYFHESPDLMAFKYFLFCAIWKLNHGYKAIEEGAVSVDDSDNDSGEVAAGVVEPGVGVRTEEAGASQTGGADSGAREDTHSGDAGNAQHHRRDRPVTTRAGE